MGTMQADGKLVVVKDGRTRRFRSKQERRAIVEETLKAGASVSLVARAHHVNTNQVFKWRRQYRAGHLEIADASNNVLLPVKIRDTPPQAEPTIARRRGKTRRTGVIDIDLGHARVRIEGAADPDCVQAALERLIR
jgi:transposase